MADELESIGNGRLHPEVVTCRVYFQPMTYTPFRRLTTLALVLLAPAFAARARRYRPESGRLLERKKAKAISEGK
jgi:hypothetical protein